jgi:hypothetical protein
VRQIENRALRKLKRALVERFPHASGPSSEGCLGMRSPRRVARRGPPRRRSGCPGTTPRLPARCPSTTTGPRRDGPPRRVARRDPTRPRSCSAGPAPGPWRRRAR